jgi:hypothetical protein
MAVSPVLVTMAIRAPQEEQAKLTPSECSAGFSTFWNSIKDSHFMQTNFISLSLV